MVEEQSLEWLERDDNSGVGRRLLISSEPRVVGLALAERTHTSIQTTVSTVDVCIPGVGWGVI